MSNEHDPAAEAATQPQLHGPSAPSAPTSDTSSGADPSVRLTASTRPTDSDEARPTAAGSPATVDSSRAPVTEAPSPLITAVEIENFKGIGRPVRVDLRPITLLFGRNSAGKSTLLHALCYAHEILSHRNVDAGKVELGGDQIDLGGFQTFVHGHDVERSVRLRFELNLEHWGKEPPDGAKDKGPEGSLADRLDTHGGGIPFGYPLRSGWVELVVSWRHDQQESALVTYEVGADELVVGRIRSDAVDHYLDFNWAHPLFDEFHTPDTMSANRRVDLLSEAPGPKTDGSRFHSVRAHGPTLPLPDWEKLLNLDYRDLKGNKDLTRVFDDPITVGSPHERFEGLMSEVFVGFGRFLRNELADLRYIGPVRELRPATAVQPGSHAQGMWSDGSAAWSLLLQSDPVPNKPVLLEAVNDWLEDAHRLNTGYKLRRRSMVELPADEGPVSGIRSLDRLPAKYRNEDGDVDLEHWVRKEATHIADLVGAEPDDVESRIKALRAEGGDTDEMNALDPDDSTARLLQAVHELYQVLADLMASVDVLEHGGAAVKDLVHAIAAAPLRTTLQLVTAGSELPVRTSDIGVGISQLLPVVVAALDPHRPGITAIEQPELHLHPGLQVELGDLFAQPLDDERVFLLENHSEHLMLRLLRRIEETNSGELPEGKPALRPDQVAAVFLEQIDGEVRATPLRIDETGEFIDRWPRGFFRERAAELF